MKGDNLIALKSLKSSYDKKINVIYIDPPYNTGNTSFNYNDKFDNNSWVEFIKDRLVLAQALLSENGAIFISIDDFELGNLKVLCDKVFGHKNFVCNFIRKCKSGTNNNVKHITIEFDYVLCYAKNKSKLQFTHKEYQPDISKFPFEDDHVSSRGKFSLRSLEYKGSYSSSMDYQIESPNGKLLLPGSRAGPPYTWRWSRSKLEWGIKNDFIVFKKRNNRWKVYYKQYQFVDNKNQKKQPKRAFNAIIDFPNSRGSQRLKEILPTQHFSYPKPVELIQFFLQLFPNKNLTILDFFGGSGTTMHATMLQNEVDEGTRRCITITNNENNICQNITYPRIKKIIDGYTKTNHKKVSGLSKNQLRYFKC